MNAKIHTEGSIMATILMLCVVLRADMHRECWPLNGQTCEQAQHRWVEQAANWNRRVALPPAALCGCALVPAGEPPHPNQADNRKPAQE